MKERAGLVTMRGNPLTLVGDEVKVGEVAPNFVALDLNLTLIKFSSYQNKICIIPPFEEIPDNWACPVCGAAKDMFEKIEE